ncbi:MAG: hypothetical protein Q8P67_09930 [archaeon]|nr:hypothetical protein [archaeon]
MLTSTLAILAIPPMMISSCRIPIELSVIGSSSLILQEARSKKQEEAQAQEAKRTKKWFLENASTANEWQP